jgi:hypothetical protein
MGELSQLPEDDRYDVEDYYARCKRHATKHEELSEEAEDSEAEGETTEDAGK